MDIPDNRDKTGKWIKNRFHEESYTCSECAIQTYNKYWYCPGCGAKKMDIKEVNRDTQEWRQSGIKAKFYDIDCWYKEMINMPIELPKTYIDGWNAGRKNEPYDNTKPTTWQIGYNDGRYNLLSSLL